MQIGRLHVIIVMRILNDTNPRWTIFHVEAGCHLGHPTLYDRKIFLSHWVRPVQNKNQIEGGR